MYQLVLFTLISVNPTPSESTLLATERILEREQDLSRRIPLLIRWMKLVQEVNGAEKGEDLIFSRLKVEVEEMGKRAQGGELDPLLRQYGWRLAAQKKWQDAVQVFKQMQSRQPKDDLVYGDSLLALGLSTLALENLESAKQGLPALAAYKKAWAYLQLNDHKSALKEFDDALKRTPEAEGDIRAQAFQERLLSYTAVYNRSSFTEVEVDELRTLANQVFGGVSLSTDEEIKKALKKIVEGFLGRGETNLARQAFDQLLQIAPDQNEFSLSTAGIWIGIYRAKLQHEDVARLLEGLPSNPLPTETYASLFDELKKTASFYESLVSEKEADRSKKILTLTYQKIFQIFPSSSGLTEMRLNSAKLAWDRGDVEGCLSDLAPLSKEERSSSGGLKIVAQCHLKRLDESRAMKRDSLTSELKLALLDEKLYKAFPDPESKSLFEGLVRILLSEVSRSSSLELRTMLSEILREFPFDKNSSLYREVQAMDAQQKFISLGGKTGAEAGDDYFALFQESDQFSELGQKALGNSILLATSTTLAGRCDKWMELRGTKAKSEDPIWLHCYRGVESAFDLERMNQYLQLAQANLSEDLQIRFGLVELALDKPGALKRLERMKSESATLAVKAWVGPKGFVPEVSREANVLLGEISGLEASLKPMKRVLWESKIPSMIKKWEVLDQKIVTHLKREQGEVAADLIYGRVSMTRSLLRWIELMPKPHFKNDEDRVAYEGQMRQVSDVWEGQIEERSRECSEKAYYISRSFIPKDQALCPERVTSEDLDLALKSWKESPSAKASDLASDPQQELAQRMLDHGLTEMNELRARYWLLSSLDFLKSSEDRARAFVGLAQKTRNAIYWGMALSLNPRSLDALQGFRRNAKVNGVQERIVDAKIKYLQEVN